MARLYLLLGLGVILSLLTFGAVHYIKAYQEQKIEADLAKSAAKANADALTAENARYKYLDSLLARTALEKAHVEAQKRSLLTQLDKMKGVTDADKMCLKRRIPDAVAVRLRDLARGANPSH